MGHINNIAQTIRQYANFIIQQDTIATLQRLEREAEEEIRRRRRESEERKGRESLNRWFSSIGSEESGSGRGSGDYGYRDGLQSGDSGDQGLRRVSRSSATDDAYEYTSSPPTLRDRVMNNDKRRR